MQAIKVQLLFHFGNIIRHGGDCWSSSHNKVLQVGLQQHRDSNMSYCSSYGCSNSTGEDSFSELSFCYPLNRPELKQWSSGFVGTVTDHNTMNMDAG